MKIRFNECLSLYKISRQIIFSRTLLFKHRVFNVVGETRQDKVRYPMIGIAKEGEERERERKKRLYVRVYNFVKDIKHNVDEGNIVVVYR